MDINKITHDILEVTKHPHLPILAGLIGYIHITPKMGAKVDSSGLGEVTGDNILPKDILISLSRRSR